MSEGVLIAFAVVMFTWGIVSGALARMNLTGPFVFMFAGLIVANPEWGIVTVDIDHEVVHTVAELTLALVLFVDASGVRLASARADLPITVRLLAVGLPLSMVLGGVIGVALFGSLPVALVGVVAAGLAPTDAALSASIISDGRLPDGVRRVLNVESGLNDGIATPVVTFCIAAAATALGIEAHGFESGWRAVGELAIGAAIGAALGAFGGFLLLYAHGRGWMVHASRVLATLGLALLAFLVASQVGGNPFVSAFIAGLAFGAVSGRATTPSVELTELGSGFLSLALWFVFGAGFVWPAFEDVSVDVLVYALCSLTIVRMVPVAIALARSGVGWATTAFVGWFGPRGLASVVFALLTVEDLGLTDPRVEATVHVMVVTVVLSVVAHGVSAGPLATRYVRALGRSDRAAAPIERLG